MLFSSEAKNIADDFKSEYISNNKTIVYDKVSFAIKEAAAQGKYSAEIWLCDFKYQNQLYKIMKPILKNRGYRVKKYDGGCDICLLVYWKKPRNK